MVLYPGTWYFVPCIMPTAAVIPADCQYKLRVTTAYQRWELRTVRVITIPGINQYYPRERTNLITNNSRSGAAAMDGAGRR